MLTLNQKRKIFKKQKKAKNIRIEKDLKSITFFTGAGISKESGLSTFRDSDGLWNNYNVMSVASLTGFRDNPKLIHHFYNGLRKELENAEPNSAHFNIRNFESDYDVSVITQNIDDFHERVGSENVLHLHGELTKAQLVCNPKVVFDIGYKDTSVDDRYLYGKEHLPIRPNVVFFQEQINNFDNAKNKIIDSDVVVIIGTSLNVQPAASLINYIPYDAKVILIDPNDVDITLPFKDFIHLKETATVGMEELKKILL